MRQAFSGIGSSVASRHQTEPIPFRPERCKNASIERIFMASQPMRPEEIKELLDAKPFAPFRLHMTDGNSLDITQPDNAIVSRAKIVLGVGSDAATGIA